MNNSQTYASIFLRDHLQDKVCALCLSQDRHFVKNMAVVLRIQEDFPTLLKYFNANKDRICWECNAQLRKFIRFHNQVQLARDMLNKMSDYAGAGYMPKINSISRLSRSSLRGVVHILPREVMLGNRGILQKGDKIIPRSMNVKMNATIPQQQMAASNKMNLNPIITSVTSLTQSTVQNINIEPISMYPPYESHSSYVVPQTVKVEFEEITLKEPDTSETDSCPDIKEELEDELPNQSQNKVMDLDKILTSTHVQKPPIRFPNPPKYNSPVRNPIPKLDTVQNTSKLEQNKIVPVNTSSNQMTVTSGPSNVDPNARNNDVRIIVLSRRMLMELRERERVYLSNMRTGFNCDKCIFNIQKEEVYKNHMARHDPSAGLLVCDICEMRFPNKVALLPHYKSHFRAFACNRCRKTTFACRLWSTMQTHLRMHDFPGCAACGECGIVSENKVLLKEHIDSMHRVECPKCKFKFKSQAKVDYHIQFVHTEMKCKKCNQSIKGVKALKLHQQACKLSYGDPGDGAVVIVGEDGSNQAYCAKCNKFFKSRNILLIHLKTHSSHVGIRFKCDYCGKAYFARSSLIAHIKIAHNNGGIPCKTCGKKFSTKRARRIHVDAVHLKKKQESTHPCDVCGKMFISQSVLKNHLMIHSGIRPFQCKLCPWNFTQSSTLYTHMRLKHKIGKKAESEAVKQKLGKKAKSAAAKQKTGKKARSKAVKQKASETELEAKE